jgi:hypothetical protein
VLEQSLDDLFVQAWALEPAEHATGHAAPDGVGWDVDIARIQLLQVTEWLVHFLRAGGGQWSPKERTARWGDG